MKSIKALKCLLVLGLMGAAGSLTVKAEELNPDTQEFAEVTNQTTESKDEETETEAFTEVTEVSEEDTQTPTVTSPVSIGDQAYDSLNAAIEAVKERQTITINQDIENATGIKVESDKNFTIDFQGHTYVLTDPGAGSTGTETNGFQLLKDSTITLKNGIIRIAENATEIKRIIQNYADLTLEDMTFYTEHQTPDENYALSFNNGNITFKGNTSIIMSDENGIAFDVCKFGNYPSVSVTFDESYTGTIDGTIRYDSPDAETHSLTINGNGTFSDIQLSENVKQTPAIAVNSGTFDRLDVLDYVKENAQVTIVLKENETKNVVIPKDSTVTIDLNGHTITNNNDHTILNNGNLTIKGDGSVDNVSHAKAAVYNELGATAVLNGGTYTRSQEAGSSSTESGKNSFYNIVNHGTMILNKGVTVSQNGAFSSLIENGWYDGTQNGTQTPSQMIINGGTFSGGLNTIKNDDWGKLTIKDGTFENVAQAAVLNWNETIIEGGTFNSGQSTILNGKTDDVMDKGTLTITGGKFTSGSGFDVVGQMQGKPEDFTEVTIQGGQFNGKIDQSLIAPGYELDGNGNVVTDRPSYRPSTSTSTTKKVSAETVDGDKVKVKEVKVDKDLENALFAKKSTVTAIEVGKAADDVIVTYKAGREYKDTVLYVVGYDEETKKAVLLDTIEADSKGTVEFITKGNREITLVSVIKGWIQDEKGTWYFFDYTTGEQKKNGWLAEGTDWYYLDATGAMRTNAWVWRDSNSAYYVNADGKMIYGPTYITGYYVNEKGLWIR